jgi:hypothetical protein
MNVDLSRFKVIYDEKVLNAVSLQEVVFSDYVDWDDVYKIPKLIEIIAINEDGNIQVLRDKTWKFQFIPILSEVEI